MAAAGPDTGAIDHFATLELVKKALIRNARENLGWARQNLRRAMSQGGRDPNQLSALTGLSVGTIRGFLREKEPTDSSTGNVLLMALALGINPTELFLPPEGLARGEAGQVYEQLAAENPDATVSIRDVNGRAFYVSPSSRLVGYEPEDLLRLTPEETLDLVHPKDKERMMSVLTEVIANEGRRAGISYLLKKKDGSWAPRGATFWVERGEKGGQVLVMIDRPANGD